MIHIPLSHRSWILPHRLQNASSADTAPAVIAGSASVIDSDTTETATASQQHGASDTPIRETAVSYASSGQMNKHGTRVNREWRGGRVSASQHGRAARLPSLDSSQSAIVFYVIPLAYPLFLLLKRTKQTVREQMCV